MSFRKEYPAIYMGNINRHLTQADLEHVFAPLGAFQLLKHKKGESKGWGFLCFANSATANRGRTFLLSAKFMIRGLTLDVGTVRTWGTTNESLARNMDRTLAATNFETAPAEIKARIAKLSYSVFVGNLPNQMTKTELHDLFSECGDIITHFIATNSKRECLGYGFIDYFNEESAMAAVEMYDGYGYRGRILRVDLADDVNQEVPIPAATPQIRAGNVPTSNDAASKPATTTTTANVAVSWPAVGAQRQQPSPAPTVASLEQQRAPAVVPVVASPAPVAAPSPPRDLDTTIRAITPQLLQIALAVNAAEGLEFGLGVEAAAERLVKSNLCRTAVKGLCEKLEEKK